MPLCSFYSRIFESLLAECPPLAFNTPWDFLMVPDHCRGPIYDPARTMTVLRGEFSDTWLYRSGVLRQNSAGDPCLAPELLNPVGALIALRDHPERRPFAVLTPRGSLPTRHLPIWAALKDAWTAERVSRDGVLFAAPRIRDVALLRSLDLPATLSIGLLRLPPDGLRDLDARFGGQDLILPLPSTPTQEGGQAPDEGGNCEVRPAEIRPTLTLVGWSPYAHSDHSPALSPAITHLAYVRHHLGLDLAGVTVWRLGIRELESLRFRMTYRDPKLVREFMRQGIDALDDFERFTDVAGVTALGTAAPDPDYVTDQANLVAALAEGRTAGRLSVRAQRAMRGYEAAVQHDLVTPLLDWSLESSDPVTRNAGVELANACRALHKLSPLLHEMQSRQFERALEGGTEPIPEKVFTQYLALTARFGSLLRDLSQWRRS